MKINNITALDYEAQDGLLVLVLTDTNMEAVAAIDGSLLTVQTDEGDTVEVLAGYALRSVTYDLAAGTYRAVLALAMEDTAAAAYAKLAGQVEDLAKAVENADGGTVEGYDSVVQFSRIMLTTSIKSGALDGGQVIACSELIEDWVAGKYEVDDARNHNGQTWRCCQAHNNANNPDIKPGTTAGAAFWVPYHGTSIETARPWVAPTGAHDIYKAGEYMVWTDGTVQRCKQNTNYSPKDYPAAWETVSAPGVQTAMATLATVSILDGMTVAQLKAYAANNGIDLGGATLKADIRAAIEAAEAAKGDA